MFSAVLQEEPVDIVGVPEIYHDLAVFSKSRTICYLVLLRLEVVFLRSQPQRERLWISISSSLLWPSQSIPLPLRQEQVLLCGEEGWFIASLYRLWGMNEITIKNRYPLPLMSSVFKLLQGTTVFTKLDLCYAYHITIVSFSWLNYVFVIFARWTFKVLNLTSMTDINACQTQERWQSTWFRLKINSYHYKTSN